MYTFYFRNFIIVNFVILHNLLKLFIIFMQVERYTVGGIHSAPVTALEWSKNSQKLFSGDATGLVVLTEMDFYMVFKN